MSKLLTATAAILLSAAPLSAKALPCTLEVDALLLPEKSAKLGLEEEATLRQILVGEGDFVRKGDTLAILYTESEELGLQKAEKKAEHAEFQRTVTSRLRRDKIVSEEEARQREIDEALARIEVLQAKAGLDEKTIKAPFDGYVLRVFKDPGEVVGRVDKIVEMVDYSSLVAEAYVESQWFGRIRSKASADVKVQVLGEKVLPATVVSVDPVIDPASGLFRVRLRIENDKLSIPSGVPAKAKFTLTDDKK